MSSATVAATLTAAAAAATAAAATTEVATLLEKPLPPQVAMSMLNSLAFDPGSRPTIFGSTAGAGGQCQWLFKEHHTPVHAPETGKLSIGRPRRERLDTQRADRWHNSGGVRGSRDMCVKGSRDKVPVVRRRYGSIVRDKKITYRYHEYSLLRKSEVSGELLEDRTTVIFHVMPKRTGKGRPSKDEAEGSLALWQQHGFWRVGACA